MEKCLHVSDFTLFDMLTIKQHQSSRAHTDYITRIIRGMGVTRLRVPEKLPFPSELTSLSVV